MGRLPLHQGWRRFRHAGSGPQQLTDFLYDNSGNVTQSRFAELPDLAAQNLVRN
jgi:hypothetical protein